MDLRDLLIPAIVPIGFRRVLPGQMIPCGALRKSRHRGIPCWLPIFDSDRLVGVREIVIVATNGAPE